MNKGQDKRINIGGYEFENAKVGVDTVNGGELAFYIYGKEDGKHYHAETTMTAIEHEEGGVFPPAFILPGHMLDSIESDVNEISGKAIQRRGARAQERLAEEVLKLKEQVAEMKELVNAVYDVLACSSEIRLIVQCEEIRDVMSKISQDDVVAVGDTESPEMGPDSG